MQIIDTLLIELFLREHPYYASVTYEIDKSPKGIIEQEYVVYMMDEFGEGETIRFNKVEDMEDWLRKYMEE